MADDFLSANLRIRLFAAVGGDPAKAQAVWEIVGSELGDGRAAAEALAWGREALEGAVAAWTTERDFYAERAKRKGYSHDEAAAEAYGAAIKAVTGILAALDAPAQAATKETNDEH